MRRRHAAEIIASWESNAGAWTRTVREGRIESRRQVTDRAVLDAIRACAPRRVLDIGCGEGWLARALAGAGIEVTGVDACAALVAAARAAGGGTFHCVDYDALVAAPSRQGRFDLLVCNFALLEEDVGPLLAALRQATTAEGQLLIQTVHPWRACGDGAYEDGWRQEDFAAFGNAFAATMPWYFRTLASWLEVLASSGWRLRALSEPAAEGGALPYSLLLRASPEERAQP